MEILKAIPTQNLLLQRVQETLAPHSSLVDELADLLKISTDSIYRRLRNETSLSIDETALICKKFNISFDSIIGTSTNNVSFDYGLMRNEEDFTKHMKFIAGEIEYFKNTPNTQMVYAAIDIPIFHHFEFTELTEFKLYYWLRSVVNDSAFTSRKFSKGIISSELMDVCKKAYGTYKAVNKTEIWTDTTVNSLIRQIDFLWESGMFETNEDALLICDQAEQEINSIRELAGTHDPEHSGYKLYFSEIELGNNCIYAKNDHFSRAYLSYNTINILVTTNNNYCNETEKWLQNFIKKSTLISGASEKIRYQFFKRALDNISKLKTKIQDQ